MLHFVENVSDLGSCLQALLVFLIILLPSFDDALSIVRRRVGWYQRGLEVSNIVGTPT